MTSISNTPFFIVGVHRSGTTLLRYMLNSGERIYIPEESDFIPRFFIKEPHKPVNAAKIHSMIELIFNKYRFIDTWQGSKPSVEQFFLIDGQFITPAQFLDRLYSNYAHQQGAERWGDKTPIYTSYIPLLHSIFPESKFVHVIRDGRDVALSMLDKWCRSEFHVDIYYCTKIWERRIRQAQSAGKLLGSDLYYEVFYEDLVRNPEKELCKICDFLHEPFDSRMTQPHLLGRQLLSEDNFHAPIRQPPSTSRIARWKNKMSPEDLWIFQKVAATTLRDLGYPLSVQSPIGIKSELRFHYLATKYWILQTGRALLQRVGLMPPI